MPDLLEKLQFWHVNQPKVGAKREGWDLEKWSGIAYWGSELVIYYFNAFCTAVMIQLCWFVKNVDFSNTAKNAKAAKSQTSTK